jgi:hypothetical protein
MSNESARNRGRLFDNRNKGKPSQPDMQGDGRIDGKPYAILAWKRDDQLVLSFAAPRADKNANAPEEFRGALDPAPAQRGGGEDPTPVWTGDIIGSGGSFAVRAFEQEGKSGRYLSLELD